MSLAEKIALLTFAPALLAAVVALALDAFGSRRAAVWVSVAGLTLSAGAAGWGVAATTSAKAWDVLAIGGVFSAAGCAVFALGAVCLLGGFGWFVERAHGGSWAALLAIAAAGSAAAATALDLVTLLIALETLAACSYALVGATRDRRADEAALKYFVQGAVATGVFVLALVPLIGIFAPDGAYSTLGGALSGARLAMPALMGGVLLTSSLAFKAGAVPFHSWAPDAYESAPPAVAAFLATAPKIGAIGALAVVTLAFSVDPFGDRISTVLAVLAVLSVVVGSVAALAQRGYRRMLGYAGVAQVGYALVALAAGYPPAALLFTVTYAVASAACFMAAGAFSRLDPTWDGSIEGMAGFGRRSPLVSLATSLALVSLAGVPPLLGFWGKFWAFGAAIQRDHLWLALVAIAGSVVSVAYYGSVLRALFLADSAEDSSESARVGEAPVASGGSEGRAVVLLGVVTLLLGLAPLVWGVGLLLTPFVLG